MSLVSIVGLNKAEGCREKRRRKRDREAEMRPVERGFISEQVSTILAPPQPLLKKCLAVSCFFSFFSRSLSLSPPQILVPQWDPGDMSSGYN